MSDALDFGSLNRVLAESSPSRNLASWDKGLVQTGTPGPTQSLLRSAGPVSDRYILSTDPVSLLNGPGGSGKTVASVKKALVSAQRMVPVGTRSGKPLRRYVLGVWRQKYGNLWGATIPSWWSVFPKDLPGSSWVGASPRPALHTITFEDAFGYIELVAMFEAFGEVASAEDLRGKQFSDVYLNELDTLPEELFSYLADRVGRDPPAALMKRTGRYYGDCNAPDVTSWVYRDFWEAPKPGYVLYRQPGGRSPEAENPAVGREYYENSARLNAHRPWWVRRMVDNVPGITQGTDLVYPGYDDERMFGENVTLEVYPEIPIVVGVDGGYTPAAVYTQEVRGQTRVLAEIAMDRGGMEELAREMLALEARRFGKCEFLTVCDPSMAAGEGDDETFDLEAGSDRQRLADALGREVELAPTNEPTRRWDAVRDPIGLNLGPGRPGLILDGSCKTLRRGFLQTYQFRKVRGTTEVGSVMKSFESHVHDGLQYASLLRGTDAARKRRTDIRRARQERRKASRTSGRYNPLRRRA